VVGEMGFGLLENNLEKNHGLESYCLETAVVVTG